MIVEGGRKMLVGVKRVTKKCFHEWGGGGDKDEHV